MTTTNGTYTAAEILSARREAFADGAEIGCHFPKMTAAQIADKAIEIFPDPDPPRTRTDKGKPESKTNQFVGFLGPDGQVVLNSIPGLDEDASFLWDCTERWSCDEADIQKVIVTVEVPVLGSRPIELSGSLAPEPANAEEERE